MYFRTDQPHRGRSLRSGPRWPAWCREHFVVLLAVGTLAYTSVLFQARGDNSEWNVCFVRAARHMVAHEAIHRLDEGNCYSYPPAMALLATPFSNLSPAESLWVWWGVNVAAMAAWFVFSWRMAGGASPLRLSISWFLILLVALLMCARWNLTTLEHQQFDFVIAALLMSGCYLLWRGHSLGAGALLGAATAMKCTPLLFAPYLLWRRKPGAALLLVAVAMGLNLLPDLVFPQSNGNSYVTDWVRFLNQEIGTSAPGTWRSDPLLNQSLAGLFLRWALLGLRLSANLHWGPMEPWMIPWLRLATYGTGLSLLAMSFWRFGGPLRSPQIVSSREPVPVDASHLRLGWEVSIILCLMLLLSPMSSKAHYVVLFLPCLLLARQLIEKPSRFIRVVHVLLLVCGPLTFKGLTGKALGDLILAWGVPTLFVLVTWYGAWKALAPRIQTFAPTLRKTHNVKHAA